MPIAQPYMSFESAVNNGFPIFFLGVTFANVTLFLTTICNPDSLGNKMSRFRFPDLSKRWKATARASKNDRRKDNNQQRWNSMYSFVQFLCGVQPMILAANAGLFLSTF